MGNSYNKVAEIKTAQYAGTTEKWTAAAPQHLSGVPLEESDEGKSSRGQNFKCTRFFTLLGSSSDQMND